MVTILWKILRCFLWTIIVLLSLIVVIILVVVGIELYTHIERKNTYNSHIEIEKLIGYDIPPFDVLDYEEENVNNHLVQGYTMKKTILFTELPDSIYYNYLDSLCNNDNCWTWNKFKKEHKIKLDSLIVVNKERLDAMDDNSCVEYIDKLDSLVKYEYLDWDSLTDCYEFYNGIVRINIEKGNNIASIEYKDIEIDH